MAISYLEILIKYLDVLDRIEFNLKRLIENHDMDYLDPIRDKDKIHRANKESAKLDDLFEMFKMFP